jgi:tetratricopeptide (TPR) repeat protein
MNGVSQTGRRALLSLTLLLTYAVHFAATQADFEQLLNSAEESFKKGDLPRAETLLLAAEKFNPKSFLVHNNLGTLYLQQRRYPLAIKEFRIAAALNLKSADVARNLGTSYFLSKDYAGALKPLARAKQLDERDVRTRYQLGYALLMLNRPTEAQAELEYVRRALPGDEGTLFALVKVYEAGRDQQNASQAFEELKNSNPNSIFVHILLGESYDIQENWPSAMAEYQKAIEQAPSMPRLHFDLGFLHWEQAHYAEAGNEFAKELELNPGFVPALYYQGEIALSTEKPTGALALFRAASDRDQACLEPWLGQGKALVRLNRPAEAIRCFEKAAKIDAGQPDVYYWMATAYRRLQRLTESKRAMERFKALSDEGKASSLGERKDRWSGPACESGWGSIQP